MWVQALMAPQENSRKARPGHDSKLPGSPVAEWSSWSARQAHNLEVAGSTPASATYTPLTFPPGRPPRLGGGLLPNPDIVTRWTFRPHGYGKALTDV